MSKPKILHFSVSLNVKDIEASKAFYEKLGFEPYEGAGSIEEKWLIMVYGDAKIGLFQDMFPLNTITLNPDDARTMMKTAKENGLETTSEMGMDEASGPAAFSLVDPDGNPVLIDQHF